jgi:hypothetical protein
MSYVGTDRYTIATSEVRIKKLLILIKLWVTILWSVSVWSFYNGKNALNV